MIISRRYALRLLRANRAVNARALKPDERGRVYVALDVYYPRTGWAVHHYLEKRPVQNTGPAHLVMDRWVPPGSIGVMLCDTRTPPRMFVLTEEPHRMGIAYFAPLDDPQARVAHRVSEFWPLIDSLP